MPTVTEIFDTDTLARLAIEAVGDFLGLRATRFAIVQREGKIYFQYDKRRSLFRTTRYERELTAILAASLEI